MSATLIPSKPSCDRVGSAASVSSFPPPTPSLQLTEIEGDSVEDAKTNAHFFAQIRNWAKLSVESMPDRLERYLDYFTVPTAHLRSMVEAFEDELHLGLDMFAAHPYKWDPSKCSFKMLDSCVKTLPTGNETGVYYALDFGGTNFRVVRANLLGNNTIHKSQLKLSLSDAPNAKHLPRGLMDSRATATKLFDFFATTSKELMTDENDYKPASQNTPHHKRRDSSLDYQAMLKAGFTFSFPCSQRFVDSAVLIEWTKGFQTGRATNDPVEGLDVVQLADAAFRRHDIPLAVTSVLNDTVGTLLSCCYEMDQKAHPPCLVGLILGTGVNACYYEKEAQSYGYVGNVINIECGNFNRRLLLSNVDDEVDFAEVSNRGCQRMEKMIAGAYLGEICRRAIVKVLQHLAPEAAWKPFSFSSADASTVIEDTSSDFSTTHSIMRQVWNADFSPKELCVAHRLCTAIIKRSAALAAVIVCATAKKTQHLQPAMGGVTVAIDGSLYKCVPFFRAQLRAHMDAILGRETSKLIHLLSADDGSGKGAAVLAAALDAEASQS